VNTLGTLGGEVRHQHATINTTTRLAWGSTRALSLGNSALRGRGRRHPLVTSTWRSALSTHFHAGGASCATLGFLYSGASCATWMRPGGGASCATAGCGPDAASPALPCGMGLGMAAPPATSSCYCAEPSSSADSVPTVAIED
jgi:hypothetical protein